MKEIEEREQAGPRIGDIRQHPIGGFASAGPTS